MADYPCIFAKSQDCIVRCPGHGIHFLDFGYNEFRQKVIELAEIKPVGKEVKKYVSKWTPY